MNKTITAAVLALSALALSGCAQVQTGATDVADVVGAAITRGETDVALFNNTLANLAANDIPKACGIIAVAEGYYANVATWVPVAQPTQERPAAAAVKVICDKPPTNIFQAFASLYNSWVAIQAATTVPPAVPAG